MLAGSPFDGELAPAPSAAAVPSVLIDPLGKYVYMTRYTTDATDAPYVDASAIDPATGALTAIATYPL